MHQMHRTGAVMAPPVPGHGLAGMGQPSAPRQDLRRNFKQKFQQWNGRYRKVTPGSKPKKTAGKPSSKKSRRKYGERLANKRPPTCKLPDGTVYTLDSALRKGIADCPAGDQQMFATNVDILDALEGNSPRVEPVGEDVESGDEASCPEAPHHSTDAESDDEDESLPDNVRALVDSDKRQLAFYTVHLEDKVCGLQKELADAQAQIAMLSMSTANDVAACSAPESSDIANE